MKHTAIVFAAAAVAACASGLQQPGEPPDADPGRRPAVPLPPGHPAIEPGPQDAAPADPQDVASIEAIVAAYYASVSGPAGAPRDWDRFRSLFMGEARFVRAGAGAGASPVMLTPQQFVQLNRRYFERSGYFESQIRQRTDAFGNIAHVFSTYESRRSPNDEEPYSRGINSIQLISSGGRWWIVTVMWDYERPDGAPIPPRYLPPGAAEDG
jgi:hypothetical protein